MRADNAKTLGEFIRRPTEEVSHSYKKLAVYRHQFNDWRSKYVFMDSSCKMHGLKKLE